MADIEGTRTDGFFLDGLLGIALRSDKEDLSTLGNDVPKGLVGLLHAFGGLVEVNDIKVVPAVVDVGLHLRVPLGNAMAEVAAGIQKGLGRDNGVVFAVDRGGHDILRLFRSSRLFDLLLFFAHLWSLLFVVLLDASRCQPNMLSMASQDVLVLKTGAA